MKGKNLFVPADNLSRHVKRVYRYSRFAHEMNHALRDRYPALDEPALPPDIAFPEPSPTLRFSWQGQAARAARAMCQTRDGGFFAAIMAGTGTGKTRGAPTILAGAAMGDTIPERRYLRMNLGLDTPFPLRDAEAHVRKQMLSTDERDPLGQYILHQNARWNLTMTRTRKFRRSEKREILFCLIGERPENAVWHLDLAPGTWQSKRREAVRLHTDDPYEVNCLFENMTARGWHELSGGVSEMTSADIYELLRVSVPTYGDDPEKEMTYTEFTGFTRGKPKDLFEAFGKSK